MYTVPQQAQMSSLPDLVNFERVALRYGRGPEVLTDATLDLPRQFHLFNRPFRHRKIDASETLLSLAYPLTRPHPHVRERQCTTDQCRAPSDKT